MLRPPCSVSENEYCRGDAKTHPLSCIDKARCGCTAIRRASCTIGGLRGAFPRRLRATTRCVLPSCGLLQPCDHRQEHVVHSLRQAVARKHETTCIQVVVLRTWTLFMPGWRSDCLKLEGKRRASEAAVSASCRAS